MLKAEVIEAVKAEKFHIWPIRSIDEGLSLLTDIEIGALQEDGTYPPRTFNQAVDTQLVKFRELLQPEKNNSDN